MMLVSITLILVELLSGAESTQPVQLRTFLRPVDYINHKFAREPLSGANFLFLPSDDVKFRVQLYSPYLNMTLSLPQEGAAQLRVSVDSPAGRRQLRASEWTVSRPVVEAMGLPDHTIDGTSPFELPEGASIFWEVSISKDVVSTPNGFVSVRVEPVVRCDGACRVDPPSDFTYEVRRRTDLRDGLEALYRQAQVATNHEMYGEAETAVNELIRQYPVTVWGYYLRAEIAERTGRRALAIQSLERAAVLLGDRGDEVVAGSLTPRAQSELREHIMRTVAGWRAAK